jgi:hypothetical protein
MVNTGSLTRHQIAITSDAINCAKIGSGGVVESDYRYYQRRAACEKAAAQRAITPAARERRMTLARTYMAKAQLSLDEPEFALAV